MKLNFSQLERAIRTVHNLTRQAQSDQHFEIAADLVIAETILRGVALEIEEAPKP